MENCRCFHTNSLYSCNCESSKYHVGWFAVVRNAVPRSFPLPPPPPVKGAIQEDPESQSVRKLRVQRVCRRYGIPPKAEDLSGSSRGNLSEYQLQWLKRKRDAWLVMIMTNTHQLPIGIVEDVSAPKLCRLLSRCPCPSGSRDSPAICSAFTTAGCPRWVLPRCPPT